MSGKSKEEVAFEILSKLKGVGIWGENNKDNILDMYSECLIAASGNRPPKGQVLQAQPQATYAPAQNPRAAAPQPMAQNQGMTPLQTELHNLQKALGE